MESSVNGNQNDLSKSKPYANEMLNMYKIKSAFIFIIYPIFTNERLN